MRALSPRQTRAFERVFQIGRVGSTGNSTGPDLYFERPSPRATSPRAPRRARADFPAPRAAVVFTPNLPAPVSGRRGLTIALAAAAGVLVLLAILVGVAVNGGTSYTCPGGDASDLSLCQEVGR